MSPVLSTFSGTSARAFGFGYSLAASAFEHIETQTVGAGGAASVTFSSIAGTYKHLQIRANVSLSAADDVIARFNSDTGNNYRGHQFSASIPNISTSQTFGGLYNGLDLMYIGGSAGDRGVFVCDILDYTSTSKNKTIRSLQGWDNNSNSGLAFISGVWLNTNAVTSITVKPVSANFQQHAAISLYGVK